jgi:ribose-phosphate pyrophosphokinase
MSPTDLALFTLAGSEEYAGRVAKQLECPLTPVEERSFEDGEHKVRSLVPVEGKDAYVIHALHSKTTAQSA